jgi:hypothetical protein
MLYEGQSAGCPTPRAPIPTIAPPGGVIPGTNLSFQGSLDASG